MAFLAFKKKKKSYTGVEERNKNTYVSVKIMKK